MQRFSKRNFSKLTTSLPFPSIYFKSLEKYIPPFYTVLLPFSPYTLLSLSLFAFNVTNWPISWLIRVEMRHVFRSTNSLLSFFSLKKPKKILTLSLYIRTILCIYAQYFGLVYLLVAGYHLGNLWQSVLCSLTWVRCWFSFFIFCMKTRLFLRLSTYFIYLENLFGLIIFCLLPFSFLFICSFSLDGEDTCMRGKTEPFSSSVFVLLGRDSFVEILKIEAICTFFIKKAIVLVVALS